MTDNILDTLKARITHLSEHAPTAAERTMALSLLALIAVEEERETYNLLHYFSKPEKTLNDIVKEAAEAED